MLPLIVLFKKKKEAIDGDVTGNRIRMNNNWPRNIYQKPKAN
jgi:hypothetical protein